MEELEAKVAAILTASDSAQALLVGLKDSLDKAIATGNMAKVKEFSDKLGIEAEELAAAVVANTPAT